MRASTTNTLIAFAVILAAAAAGGALAGVPSMRAVELSTASPRLGDAALLTQYRRPSSVPVPEDNAITPERVELGRMLFFDPLLSGSRVISCASCHNPGLSWGDGNPRAIGHGMKELDRRSPTILNVAWASTLFWDGRAESLEQQALAPIQAADEMNLPLHEMERRLDAVAAYKARFAAAYPGEPRNAQTVARAIATYERTIVSGEAPFDRWVAGNESALSTEAKEGFRLFNGKANCARCHSGWRFTDDSFHDIGVPGNDSGRGRVLADVEGSAFGFKTPTLRNVAQRHPYMHDGSERTLADVIELYDMGGRVRRASISDEIKPLHLSAPERRAILAFLATLTSHDPAVRLPTLPR